MAGAKLSPRQKMINLMYLIFIAMLALNMSKEVLTAFGSMNSKLVESNQATDERNVDFLAGLKRQAEEQPAKYKPLLEKAQQVQSLSRDLDSYIEDIKTQMTATVDDPTDFEIMDKADFLDEKWFKGDNQKPDGEEFVNKINTFKNGIVTVIGENYPSIADDVKEEFSTEPETNRDNNVLPWLDYHFRGFPMVASLTKLTQIQSDVKKTESAVLSAMLQGKLTSEVSMDNYTTLMETSKSAYFNNETFDGSIVLGRKDATTKPNRVELTLDGRALNENEYTIEDGRVKLNVNSGRPGEHKIEGKLIFLESGVEKEVNVVQSFAVVPKPNSATISADKMNVVYRGVDNPMTISFAGVSDNNVVANAPGLNKVANGKYIMRPTTGRDVTINVRGTLPDGSPVNDAAKFRIKDIPKPTGTISGQDGAVKLPRNNIEIGSVGAKLEDFDFDLPLQVTSFKFKVPGQPTVTVSGNKLNSQAKSNLRKARRGDGIQIFDIKVKASGSSVKIKPAAPVFVEVAN
jgi:gliding motility-associated protein GldM